MKTPQTAALNFLTQFFRARLAQVLCIAVSLVGALMPHSALGQKQVGNTFVYPPITHEVGEWQKTISGYRGWSSTTTSVQQPATVPEPLMCNFQPTDPANFKDAVKTRIQEFIDASSLSTKLNELEAAGAPSIDSNYKKALSTFLYGNENILQHYLADTPWAPGVQLSILLSKWNAGTGHEITNANCMTLVSMQAFVLELRRVIRAYLTLPPPPPS